MKKINLLLIIIVCLLAGHLEAQDGYSYTLTHNGAYSFTIQAVPNTSANNFVTSVQSYGFTLIVPDGVTISANSSLGGSPNLTFFNGIDIAQPTIDGYLITETLGSPASLTAPSAGTNSDMFTFTVNGSPTEGTIYILENNSVIANAITPLKSFMQADMIDNGLAEFTNVVDPNSEAVTAPSSFKFETLSIEGVESNPNYITIHPIPANKEVSITSNVKIESFSLYDYSGKQLYKDSTFIEEQNIDISKLSSGVYLIRFNLENETSIVKRIVKN